MRKFIALLIILLVASGGQSQSPAKLFGISKQQLQDKIKGGWAGQTIGVTFGGPYEFQFNGTFIGDYQKLDWQPGYVKDVMLNNPGLYDDLYMDLTFVEVLNIYGLDAPVDSFARAFAHAGYTLWHANQSARYNILHGIPVPASGEWKNNPHADCIDYQIEADFAGLMSPGMPNAASAISDKIGHIMNYGDGWYGGVYIGALYSLAFVSKDVSYIISHALKCIPAQSEFYKCIADVIKWHQQFPGDWKRTWFEVQKKWANDIGCPDGVFAPFNIDAKVNAAYVVIGLLYGEGDFTKTLEISTRCGQDADCNPSSAGGILGTIIGYDRIPAYWKDGLHGAESLHFKYTNMGLNDVYSVGFEHALKMIQKNAGRINADSVFIRVQQPVTVKFEESFKELTPIAKLQPTWSSDRSELSFKFQGTGFVIKGETAKWASDSKENFTAELFIDEKKMETIELPCSYLNRRNELAWNYDLAPGDHAIKLVFTLRPQNISVDNVQVLTYKNRAMVK